MGVICEGESATPSMIGFLGLLNFICSAIVHEEEEEPSSKIGIGDSGFSERHKLYEEEGEKKMWVGID